MAEAGVVEELIELFKEQLLEHDHEFKSGHLVVSSMVDVPRQRNSWEENAEVKESRVLKLIDAWPTTAVSVLDRRMLRSLLWGFPSGDLQVWSTVRLVPWK